MIYIVLSMQNKLSHAMAYDFTATIQNNKLTLKLMSNDRFTSRVFMKNLKNDNLS